MVKDMKSRGIPIDGGGLQMHVGYNTNPTAADLATNMQRLADLGLKVYISEMDVNGCAGSSPDQEKMQYHDVVAACLAQPACAAVTVWGITDKYTWLDVANNPPAARAAPPVNCRCRCSGTRASSRNRPTRASSTGCSAGRLPARQGEAEPACYIRAGAAMPSMSRPSARVRAVASHSARRDARRGPSDFSTGQAS
jgi:hypothetical protein